jgi:hypothetical protein
MSPTIAFAGPNDHGPAQNQESGHGHKDLKYEELPEPVRKTVDGLRKNAELYHIFVTTTKQGQDVYIVEFELDDSEHQLATLADGSILKHEFTVTLESLPESVRGAIVAAAEGATIDLLEKISRPGARSNKLYYEAKWTKGEEHHTLRVNEDGLVIEHTKE